MKKINYDMSYKRLIKEISDYFHLSINQIAQKTGLSQGTLSRIGSNETAAPYPNTIARLEEGLGIIIDTSDKEHITWRVKFANVPPPPLSAVKAAQGSGYRVRFNIFPIVSIIGAGSVTPYDDTPHDVIELPYSDPDCVALRVVGDSMAPRIEEKDIVLIHNSLEPQLYDIVAIRTTGGEQLIKRMIARTEETVDLFSDNPVYKIVSIKTADVLLIQKVVAAYKQF